MTWVIAGIIAAVAFAVVGLYCMTRRTESDLIENSQCPVCGYYCLGKGGIGCIDKPYMTRRNEDDDVN